MYRLHIYIHDIYDDVQSVCVGIYIYTYTYITYICIYVYAYRGILYTHTARSHIDRFMSGCRHNLVSQFILRMIWTGLHVVYFAYDMDWLSCACA